MFSHIFHSFSKDCIIYQLKTIFLKIIFCFFHRSVFISIYGISKVFWLNLITLLTFFKTNPWFNACFKFFMCITFSVLSYKIATSFWIFHSSPSQVKMVNPYEVHVIFQDIEHQLQKDILHHFLHHNVLWNFINRSTQSYLLEAFMKLPNHINYLHPNIEDMTILYFYHNLSCIC